jgi:mono/diheme cytochrome c family protein
MTRSSLVAIAAGAGLFASAAAHVWAADAKPADAAPQSASKSIGEREFEMLNKYCVECHNYKDWKGQIAFDTMTPDQLPQDAKIWEAAIEKLSGHLMPPPGKPRPDEATRQGFIDWLETSLDEAAYAKPDPGIIALHRLNRAEYANAIRDVLHLNVDVTNLLPSDDESDGFDNIADVLKVSPAFLDQYISAARTIAIKAVGDPAVKTDFRTYLAPKDSDQNAHIEGLPLGTRGGILVTHFFPVDGEYEFNLGNLVSAGYVLGLEYKHRLVITIDGDEVFAHDVGGEADLKNVDQNQATAVAEINGHFNHIRVKVKAGPHKVGVTFVRRSYVESDETLEPFREGGGLDVIMEARRIEIGGPFETAGIGDTPSRERIFVCHPRSTAEEAPCAKQILSTIARRAFRRPVSDADLAAPMEFYQHARSTGDFDAGIRSGLMAILVSPNFLYRAEPPPTGLAPGAVYRISDLELASRLSFFLWSSVPDDELLDVASAGKLKDPKVLEGEVKRMLADPKADALVQNFAFQWLGVRAVDRVDPDRNLFPSYNDDVRDDFKTEMALWVGDIFQNDRSVLDLLTANYTYVNERLALLYGIDNVRGDQFRKVTLTDPDRWGLLGKGAVLMSTSYANRTAPVLRGQWILENVIGVPPHAPPPDVKALVENVDGVTAQTVRERMVQHRTDPSCNACHGVLDPLGLALENFDAIGQWREKDRETATVIDASGQLADGTPVSGPIDLRKALMTDPAQFVQTMTQKLMTYGLGRSIQYYDMPWVRQIVRDAAKSNYKFSSLVMGIVESEPFLKEKVPSASDGKPTKEASAQQ